MIQILLAVPETQAHRTNSLIHVTHSSNTPDESFYAPVLSSSGRKVAFLSSQRSNPKVRALWVADIEAASSGTHEPVRLDTFYVPDANDGWASAGYVKLLVFTEDPWRIFVNVSCSNQSGLIRGVHVCAAETGTLTPVRPTIRDPLPNRLGEVTFDLADAGPDRIAVSGNGRWLFYASPEAWGYRVAGSEETGFRWEPTINPDRSWGIRADSAHLSINTNTPGVLVPPTNRPILIRRNGKEGEGGGIFGGRTMEARHMEVVSNAGVGLVAMSHIEITGFRISQNAGPGILAGENLKVLASSENNVNPRVHTRLWTPVRIEENAGWGIFNASGDVYLNLHYDMLAPLNSRTSSVSGNGHSLLNPPMWESIRPTTDRSVGGENEGWIETFVHILATLSQCKASHRQEDDHRLRNATALTYALIKEPNSLHIQASARRRRPDGVRRLHRGKPGEDRTRSDAGIQSGC